MARPSDQCDQAIGRAPNSPTSQNVVIPATAEGVGFEPTETRASTVFKTVPFVRSGIPPGIGDCNG